MATTTTLSSRQAYRTVHNYIVNDHKHQIKSFFKKKWFRNIINEVKATVDQSTCSAVTKQMSRSLLVFHSLIITATTS